MKKTILSISALIILAACTQGEYKEETQEKQPAMNKSEQINDPHANIGDAKPKPAKKIVVPDEIANKFKSVIIGVKNQAKGTDVQTEVIIGQKAEVSGTPFTVLVEHYIPNFIIDQNGVITTRDAEEKNPVAKIKLFKEGEIIFDGWLYKLFPGAHGSFEDAEYELTLVKSISK